MTKNGMVHVFEHQLNGYDVKGTCHVECADCFSLKTSGGGIFLSFQKKKETIRTKGELTTGF